MIDMKSSTQGNEVLSVGDDYPWGLRLHLGNEEIEKLGMESRNVGDELIIVARVKVVDMSQTADEKEVNRSMGLQITEMDVPNTADDDKAQRMYGDNS